MKKNYVSPTISNAESGQAHPDLGAAPIFLAPAAVVTALAGVWDAAVAVNVYYYINVYGTFSISKSTC